MKIREKLLKYLTKKFEPDQMLNQKFERYDICFKTDKDGTPVTLFIGKQDENEKIKGERFVRVIVRDANGIILKDHWDAKGKT